MNKYLNVTLLYPGPAIIPVLLLLSLEPAANSLLSSPRLVLLTSPVLLRVTVTLAVPPPGGLTELSVVTAAVLLCDVDSGAVVGFDVVAAAVIGTDVVAAVVIAVVSMVVVAASVVVATTVP